MSEVELEVLDLKDLILSNNSFGPADVGEIRTAITENYGHFGELRDAVAEMEIRPDMLSPAGKTKMGVCQFLLGKFKSALTTLRTADGSAMALFYQARCQFELGQYGEAITSYEQAQTSGYNEDQCKIGIAEAKRYRGEIEDALSILDNIFGPAEQTGGIHVSAWPPRLPPSADAWTKRSRCTSEPCKPTRITPAPCSDWRSKTTAWAMTTKP